ncbi:5-methylcytosine restriction system component- like protein [Brachyspira hampsonii 30446]|uniref:5-methylcytosine restriction system component-like protein n=2 Tax=Brachyspira hampsonii TaxID=1287055 RepID=A0A2U4F2A3_9SPIR|nr:5-methylcytosine restriction system component- like protein [Brachyspira hampsonii]EKV57439.1 5-methylcytosine restriction system component- like protein [Brachyspira hampsonii 30446]MBW5394449.1 restriction endonuclease [Brachyspira hampsonii]
MDNLNNQCECKFCKNNSASFNEHKDIKCDLLIEYINNSKYREYIFGENSYGKTLSYYIGAFWLDNEYTKNIIINPKIYNIDFMKMFSKCLSYSSIIKDFDKIYSINFEEPPIDYKGNILKKGLDVLTSIHFLRMLELELHNGLKRNFIRKEENLNSKIKGKINFSNHIKKNIMAARNDRVYCSYFDYDINCLENRILKKALKICYSNIGSIYNSFSCMSFFSEVSDELHFYELHNIKLNPLYKKYKLLIKLAINIIKLKRYKDSCNENEAPPFYIDMSLLFEKYVYALLIDSLKDKSEILYQKSVLNNKFILDFIIKGSEYNYIADTKYKEIYNNDNGYEKDDIKQLSAYSRIRKVVEHLKNDKEYYNDDNYVAKCLIIYPSNNIDDIKINLENIKNIDDFVKFYKLGIYIPRFISN